MQGRWHLLGYDQRGLSCIIRAIAFLSTLLPDRYRSPPRSGGCLLQRPARFLRPRRRDLVRIVFRTISSRRRSLLPVFESIIMICIVMIMTLPAYRFELYRNSARFYAMVPGPDLTSPHPSPTIFGRGGYDEYTSDAVISLHDSSARSFCINLRCACLLCLLLLYLLGRKYG
jgi:hypothetical protein